MPMPSAQFPRSIPQHNHARNFKLGTQKQNETKFEVYPGFGAHQHGVFQS
jgi:hypothetical protein